MMLFRTYSGLRRTRLLSRRRRELGAGPGHSRTVPASQLLGFERKEDPRHRRSTPTALFGGVRRLANAFRFLHFQG